MCNYIIKKTGINCKLSGKYNGFCAKHKETGDYVLVSSSSSELSNSLSNSLSNLSISKAKSKAKSIKTKESVGRSVPMPVNYFPRIAFKYADGYSVVIDGKIYLLNKDTREIENRLIAIDQSKEYDLTTHLPIDSHVKDKLTCEDIELIKEHGFSCNIKNLNLSAERNDQRNRRSLLSTDNIIDESEGESEEDND